MFRYIFYDLSILHLPFSPIKATLARVSSDHAPNTSRLLDSTRQEPVQLHRRLDRRMYLAYRRKYNIS
jgi:hypothetical protein